jgi:hypothetical protein
MDLIKQMAQFSIDHPVINLQNVDHYHVFHPGENKPLPTSERHIEVGVWAFLEAVKRTLPKYLYEYNRQKAYDDFIVQLERQVRATTAEPDEEESC